MDDDKRYEIIDGDLFLMASPRTIHQDLILEMAVQFKKYFEGKTCRPYLSPLDVILSQETEPSKIRTVVQPDIFVICDNEKITEMNIKGAPDLIVEVISNSSKGHDMLRKLNLYRRWKVREYLMIDPQNGLVYQCVLNEENEYDIEKDIKITEKIKSKIFDGLVIDLKEVYERNKEWFLQETQEDYI
jgi:Uma2 family endonuclease